MINNDETLMNHDLQLINNHQTSNQPVIQPTVNQPLIGHTTWPLLDLTIVDHRKSLGFPICTPLIKHEPPP